MGDDGEQTEDEPFVEKKVVPYIITTAKKKRPNKRKYTNLNHHNNYDIENFSLSHILYMFTCKSWIMQPEYQRRPNLWPQLRKQQLLETIFQGHPIPSIYILCEDIEDQDGNADELCSLFDGLQRMTSVQQFRTGNLTIPRRYVPDYMVVHNQDNADNKDNKDKLKWDDLNKAGQKYFDNYKMSVYKLKSITNKQEYFKRLNYTLPQTQGERLHACNTIRSKQIQVFLNEMVAIKKIAFQEKNEKRDKTFERMCILVFIEDTHQGIDTLVEKNTVIKHAVIDYVAQDVPIAETVFSSLKTRVLEFPCEIKETHMIALLLSLKESANKADIICYYQLFTSDAYLMSHFKKLLTGSGRCRQSINNNMAYFRALGQLSSDNVLQRFIQSEQYQKAKDPEFQLLDIVVNFYQLKVNNVKLEDVLNASDSKICSICSTDTQLCVGFDGGIYDRDWTRPILVCKACNNWLSIYCLA